LVFLLLLSVVFLGGLRFLELLYKQILGTPAREEIKNMNPRYNDFKFPQIKAQPWHKVYT